MVFSSFFYKKHPPISLNMEAPRGRLGDGVGGHTPGRTRPPAGGPQSCVSVSVWLGLSLERSPRTKVCPAASVGASWKSLLWRWEPGDARG